MEGQEAKCPAPQTTGLANVRPPAKPHLSPDSETTWESKTKTTLSQYMETSMTSTIPAGIHCPAPIRKTIAWHPDKRELMRRGEAKMLHLTTRLAWLDPRQHPAPSIRYSQRSTQKGRGAERAQAFQSRLLVIQATAAHRVTIPRAVSWQVRCPILTANPHTLFGQPIAHDRPVSRGCSGTRESNRVICS